ncbi:MAG: hypothetical protein HYR86_02130, partial [Candidatus Rokubacteria bacterium]|nr:hypothetical protein [Candidatus Rokubacteria bacterium]
MSRWPLDNWHLKLLSLTIAVALWAFVVSSDRRQVTRAAPVEYVGVGPNVILVGAPRETVDVQVEVTRWTAARVGPGSLRARANLAGLGEGANRGVQHVVRPASGRDLVGRDGRIGGERLLDGASVDRRVTRHRLARGLAQHPRGRRRHAEAIGVVAEVDRARRAPRIVEADLA